MTRTINSPGFELHEIDRSQYNKKINNSLQNAPVCLVLGYADKGEDYVPQWINIKNTFNEYYGYPKNEKERYFYNTALEIINNGGICIGCKLPYDNDQKSKYAYTEYSVSCENIIELSHLAPILQSDSTILNVLEIKLRIQENPDDKDSYLTAFNKSGTMSNIELDNYLNRSTMPTTNTFRIVDISHHKYTKTYNDTVKNNNPAYWSNDCLGIVPIIVTPANALYFQNLLNFDTTDSNDPGVFNNISAFVPCYWNNSGLTIDTTTENISASLYNQFSANDKNIITISKNTIDTFPTITWKDINTYNRKYLKHIGVVVLKAFTDEANNNTINFQILESFVGSLDKKEAAVNPDVMHIDDVINQNSNYIRMFSNIEEKDVDKMNISYINNLRATSLGFYENQCKKTLNKYSTIINDINIALSKMTNTMSLQIDLVVDAGITNIVQETANIEAGRPWTLEREDDTIAWQLTILLFDSFCKNTRKDCMFICDGLKPLCLINDLKIVNPILNVTVENAIIPKFKYIKRANSSYSAGYCNWFLTTDEYSKRQFWMPPSGKVVKSYIQCSTYFHTWDAPAGITRGRLNDVIDSAFNPNQKEADYIYLNGWNYAINYPIEGIVIEGQKTFLTEYTALDRINVRRLMLWIERSVISVAKYFIYEHNTEYNRQRFVDTITPIFEKAKTGYGIQDYAIKCDNDNNTPDTIDRNELHVKIAIKPIKTIEFICISFVLTNQQASVQEEILK